ncbi:UBN2_2 domain-containing protein [Cephalotus follicularis]|uniref:UBN2_2 domain-containing protein n=1 Tax=Cephalotus follicularis TaxID=3775 RepID=A0A1Q3AP01_CEPFO|nr:UBN2_2 domain-containing protein [Cephalotus follicularis]
MYKKEYKNSMTEHMRIMFAMIRDLKNVGNVLSDEQQAVIRSLPDSWISMRQIMISRTLLMCLAMWSLRLSTRKRPALLLFFPKGENIMYIGPRAREREK